MLKAFMFFTLLFLASYYKVKSIGEIRLKGKEIPVALFGIEKPRKETNL